VELYRKSIEVMPTAEGHTYLGWALSYMDRIDEAIEHCHQAIALDPEFGNPYNDIGVYLMHKQRLDEAIPWLEKAKLAARYEPRHFPYVNLGRIYMEQGLLNKAIQEFSGALMLVPDDDSLRDQIEELKNKLN
jgi:tetratricopeptide (TPR) repeat protein